MPSNSIEIAYDAFIDQIDHNLESGGVTEALQNAVTSGDAEAVLTVVRDMAKTAAGKAKMLWMGSPVGTVLRKPSTGEMASRVITADQGIPLWRVTRTDGSVWDTHEPVLQPEADWECIFAPSSN